MQMNEDQLDAITEIINIGVGCSASSLSKMLEKRIGLHVPSVSVCTIGQLSDQLSSDEIGVNLSILQDFSGCLTGRAMLAFPRRSGYELGKMLGEEEAANGELSMDLVGLLEEIGNIVLNGVLGTIGNMTGSSLEYSVPRLAHGIEVTRMLKNTSEAVEDGSNQIVVLADAHFDVENGDITGSLILLFDADSLQGIAQKLVASPN